MIHYHDMNMVFPQPDSLACIYACECGLSTTDGTEALQWQGKILPKPPVRPMGVEEAEKRRLEKDIMFAYRYGVGPDKVADMIAKLPQPTRWERARHAIWWWMRKYPLAVSWLRIGRFHWGCGGRWNLTKDIGMGQYFECDECGQEAYETCY